VAPPQKEIHFTKFEIITRAILAGTVICLSALLTKILSPLWGGMFANFPAAMLSSFNILYYRNDSRLLLVAVRNIPPASVYFVLYGFLAAWLFSWVGILGGTVIAEFAVISLMLLVYRLTYRVA
jgi:hypothetical protein